MMPTDMARDPTAWLLLYDADCGFCRWSLSWVLRADRHRRLVPVELGSEEANALLSELQLEERAASWHLVAPDGRRWSAGAAAPPLLELLPSGRLPARVLGAAPGLTERAYRWVADHRSNFGKLIPARSRARADELVSSRRR
jgi:predicted DCC family thiol-disulfide oxidoreductase YuxK